MLWTPLILWLLPQKPHQYTLIHPRLYMTWWSFLQPSTSLWWWLMYDIMQMQKLERCKLVLSNWHGRGKSPPKMPFHKDFPIVLMNPSASAVANLSVKCTNKKGLFIELPPDCKIKSHHIRLYHCTLNDTVVATHITLNTWAVNSSASSACMFWWRKFVLTISLILSWMDPKPRILALEPVKYLPLDCILYTYISAFE